MREIEAAGGRAISAIADVCDGGAVAALVKRTTAELGPVDILVNNAAIFASLSLKPFTDITSEEWDRVLAVNVRGTFECAKAVVPGMQARGYGKIINIASGTVFKGSPLMAHYVTSKGAIIALTRSLARELGPNGIRVNCIAPGLILSDGVMAQQRLRRSVRCRQYRRPFAQAQSRCPTTCSAPWCSSRRLTAISSPGRRSWLTADR